jgi:YVTN family beta-propeller protein
VIGTATNTVVKTIPVGTTPVGVGVTPDGTQVYVANNGSNNVSVIVRPGNTVVANIPVGTAPVGATIRP